MRLRFTWLKIFFLITFSSIALAQDIQLTVECKPDQVSNYIINWQPTDPSYVGGEKVCGETAFLENGNIYSPYDFLFVESSEEIVNLPSYVSDFETGGIGESIYNSRTVFAVFPLQSSIKVNVSPPLLPNRFEIFAGEGDGNLCDSENPYSSQSEVTYDTNSSSFFDTSSLTLLRSIILTSNDYDCDSSEWGLLDPEISLEVLEVEGEEETMSSYLYDGGSCGIGVFLADGENVIVDLNYFRKPEFQVVYEGTTITDIMVAPNSGIHYLDPLRTGNTFTIQNIQTMDVNSYGYNFSENDEQIDNVLYVHLQSYSEDMMFSTDDSVYSTSLDVKCENDDTLTIYFSIPDNTTGEDLDRVFTISPGNDTEEVSYCTLNQINTITVTQYSSTGLSVDVKLGCNALLLNPGAISDNSILQDKDNDIFIFGGINDDDESNNNLFKFDIDSRSWSWISGTDSNYVTYYEEDPFPNYSNPDFGGCNSGVISPRYGASEFIDSLGNLYICGGVAYETPDSGYDDEIGEKKHDDVWKFNIENNSWDCLGRMLPRGMSEGACSYSENYGNKAWFFGGSVGDNNGFSTEKNNLVSPALFYLDLDNISVIFTGPIESLQDLSIPAVTTGDDIHPGSRVGSSMSCGPAGRPWVFGGLQVVAVSGSYPNIVYTETYMNDIWQFIPETEVWRKITLVEGTPPSSRKDSIMFHYNGIIYIFGGRDEENIFNDCYSFEEIDGVGTWTEVFSSAEERYTDFMISGGDGIPLSVFKNPARYRGYSNSVVYLYGGSTFRNETLEGNRDSLWELDVDSELFTWVYGSTVPRLVATKTDENVEGGISWSLYKEDNGDESKTCVTGTWSLIGDYVGNKRFVWSDENSEIEEGVYKVDDFLDLSSYGLIDPPCVVLDLEDVSTIDHSQTYTYTSTGDTYSASFYGDTCSEGEYGDPIEGDIISQVDVRRVYDGVEEDSYDFSVGDDVLINLVDICEYSPFEVHVDFVDPTFYVLVDDSCNLLDYSLILADTSLESSNLFVHPFLTVNDGFIISGSTIETFSLDVEQDNILIPLELRGWLSAYTDFKNDDYYFIGDNGIYLDLGENDVYSEGTFKFDASNVSQEATLTIPITGKQTSETIKSYDISVDMYPDEYNSALKRTFPLTISPKITVEFRFFDVSSGWGTDTEIDSITMLINEESITSGGSIELVADSTYSAEFSIDSGDYVFVGNMGGEGEEDFNLFGGSNLVYSGIVNGVVNLAFRSLDSLVSSIQVSLDKASVSYDHPSVACSLYNTTDFPIKYYWGLDDRVMIGIDGGTFVMGLNYVWDDSWGTVPLDELAHNVTLSSFEISKFPTTVSEYVKFLNDKLDSGLIKGNSSGGDYSGGSQVFCSSKYMLEVKTSSNSSKSNIQYSGTVFSPRTRVGYGGESFSTEHHPVNMVTWYGAALFCNWLSEKYGITKYYDETTFSVVGQASKSFRLPTEAEWEYAAGWDVDNTVSKQRIFSVTSDDTIDNSRSNYKYSPSLYSNPLGFADLPYTSPVGWYDGTNLINLGGTLDKTRMSTSFFGVSDMVGGVREWCNDWYSAYSVYGSFTNPLGPTSPPAGSLKVMRGGCFQDTETDIRATNRYSSAMEPIQSLAWSNGFRVAKKVTDYDYTLEPHTSKSFLVPLKTNSGDRINTTDVSIYVDLSEIPVFSGVERDFSVYLAKIDPLTISVFPRYCGAYCVITSSAVISVNGVAKSEGQTVFNVFMGDNVVIDEDGGSFSFDVKSYREGSPEVEYSDFSVTSFYVGNTLVPHEFENDKKFSLNISKNDGKSERNTTVSSNMSVEGENESALYGSNLSFTLNQSGTGEDDTYYVYLYRDTDSADFLSSNVFIDENCIFIEENLDKYLNYLDFNEDSRDGQVFYTVIGDGVSPDNMDVNNYYNYVYRNSFDFPTFAYRIKSGDNYIENFLDMGIGRFDVCEVKSQISMSKDVDIENDEIRIPLEYEEVPEEKFEGYFVMASTLSTNKFPLGIYPDKKYGFLCVGIEDDYALYKITREIDDGDTFVNIQARGDGVCNVVSVVAGNQPLDIDMFIDVPPEFWPLSEYAAYQGTIKLNREYLDEESTTISITGGVGSIPESLDKQELNLELSNNYIDRYTIESAVEGESGIVTDSSPDIGFGLELGSYLTISGDENSWSDSLSTSSATYSNGILNTFGGNAYLMLKDRISGLSESKTYMFVPRPVISDIYSVSGDDDIELRVGKISDARSVAIVSEDGDLIVKNSGMLSVGDIVRVFSGSDPTKENPSPTVSKDDLLNVYSIDRGESGDEVSLRFTDSEYEEKINFSGINDYFLVVFYSPEEYSVRVSERDLDFKLSQVRIWNSRFYSDYPTMSISPYWTRYPFSTFYGKGYLAQDFVSTMNYSKVGLYDIMNTESDFERYCFYPKPNEFMEFSFIQRPQSSIFSSSVINVANDLNEVFLTDGLGDSSVNLDENTVILTRRDFNDEDVVSFNALSSVYSSTDNVEVGDNEIPDIVRNSYGPFGEEDFYILVSDYSIGKLSVSGEYEEQPNGVFNSPINASIVFKGGNSVAVGLDDYSISFGVYDLIINQFVPKILDPSFMSRGSIKSMCYGPNSSINSENLDIIISTSENEIFRYCDSCSIVGNSSFYRIGSYIGKDVRLSSYLGRNFLFILSNNGVKIVEYDSLMNFVNESTVSLEFASYRALVDVVLVGDTFYSVAFGDDVYSLISVKITEGNVVLETNVSTFNTPYQINNVVFKNVSPDVFESYVANNNYIRKFNLVKSGVDFTLSDFCSNPFTLNVGVLSYSPSGLNAFFYKKDSLDSPHFNSSVFKSGVESLQFSDPAAKEIHYIKENNYRYGVNTLPYPLTPRKEYKLNFLHGNYSPITPLLSQGSEAIQSGNNVGITDDYLDGARDAQSPYSDAGAISFDSESNVQGELSGEVFVISSRILKVVDIETGVVLREIGRIPDWVLSVESILFNKDGNMFSVIYANNIHGEKMKYLAAVNVNDGRIEKVFDLGGIEAVGSFFGNDGLLYTIK